MESSISFRRSVEELVGHIPTGRVMTYGQIAALCGNARASRIVGSIAHFGDPHLPWQRVVNKTGGLAAGYPGGRSAHKRALVSEGITMDGGDRVDVEKYIWWPSNSGTVRSLDDAQLPLMAIVGQTASGKSRLGIEIAQVFNGEIICADALTVRRGINIGSAKPSRADQRLVRHHLLDIADAGEPFTAADFKEHAVKAIADIRQRNKMPIMVGGSGLYIDAVLYDYRFLPVAPEVRKELVDMNLQQLAERAALLKVNMQGLDLKNKRRLIRFIETGGAQSARSNLRSDALIIGLRHTSEGLREAVKKRLQNMKRQGLKAEVTSLSRLYEWDSPALMGIGYREWKGYFLNEKPEEEIETQIIKDTLHYAKRQDTWFKRNKSIHWYTAPVNSTEVVDFIATHMSK